MEIMTAEQQNSTGPSEERVISPAKRKRLQQLFEHAARTSDEAAAKGVASNYDYANDLFMQCVVGDPENRTYLQAMLANLYKKFKGKKKSRFSGWKGSSERTAIKKAASKKNWDEVFKLGVKLLKMNPYDAAALLPMAEACEKLQYHEAQLAYLKGAFVGNVKNAEVNRKCAKALARRGRFDDAIECWRRVKEIDPSDEDAEPMIAKLAVEKTIKHGNYDAAESTTDVMADQQAQAERRGEVQKVTPEQKFRKLIEEDPSELGHYLELADILKREDSFKEAEQVMQKALEVSGGDRKIREQLEDLAIARMRQQIRVAERRAKEEKTDESKQLVKGMLGDLNRYELEVFSSRATRYPANVGFKYELGVRLRRAGNYNEAIKNLQQARTDAKRKGLAHLELGECFRFVKQYSLAVGAYETAIESLTVREKEQRKLALYWAGKVSLLGLKDCEKSEKFLTELGGIDFGYKDLQVLLDKLTELRDNP